MPKKDKSRKKHTGTQNSRELILKVEGQEYATAGKMLGSGRFRALCQDGKERLCIICGTMRNRTWISEGDLVLITLREFEDDKADVVHKYSVEEARKLKKLGQTNLESNNKEKEENNEDDLGIDFDTI